jgi:hypothetical protein
MRRIHQPPVNPGRRDLEHHHFRPGFIAVLTGLVLVLLGARHLTGVGTMTGSIATETQLIAGFASGGLQYADRIAPAPPPKLDDPIAAAEALDRWERQQAGIRPPTWKVRVDTESRAACPT